MKTCTNRLKSENVLRSILVTQQSLTPFAKACISEISGKFHLEEKFCLPHIQNIGSTYSCIRCFKLKEHVLVPEHGVLTNEEKKTLLERYTVKETQLPRIQATDPLQNTMGLSVHKL
ncbi:hypothetical protein DVH24_029455 [Malus domestica]|uniref:RNA polymerase subunit H/Rpb5 C-terminal domain-containing protein n=1 Tax=Malus domestica TaxID=3750 RepID=A0A498HX52_MALDO|nr:hypothetical protein DVH24_029455 [Malus domestica]